MKKQIISKCVAAKEEEEEEGVSCPTIAIFCDVLSSSSQHFDGSMSDDVILRSSADVITWEVRNPEVIARYFFKANSKLSIVSSY